MHRGIGHIRYYKDEWKVNVAIDDELAKYYRSLIPKYYTIKPQRYQTHITVVRGEEIPNKTPWGLFENKEIEFIYSNVRNGKVYWWLDAYSDFLINLRLGLGL